MRLHSCSGSLISVTRWSGLGTILRSRWGYELAFLPWWVSGIGPRAYVTHSLGTQISQDCVLIPWPDRATGFALQLGKAMGCALCPNVTVSRTAENTGMGCTASSVLWLGSQVRQGKAVFISEWGCKLVFLSRQSGKTDPSLARIFVVLTQVNPLFLGQTGPPQPGSSAGWSPCLSVAAQLPVVLAGLLVGRGWS